jgi:hypothetical protein
MGYYQYSSTAPLEEHVISAKSGVGRSLTYRVVFLEPRLESALTFGKGSRLRIEGELENLPVNLAWQSAPGRGHYLMVSPALVRQLKLKLGDAVTVRFNPVAEDTVVLPETLENALRASSKHRKLWAALTPGRQRGLSAFVTAVRSPEAQARRVETVFEELATGVTIKTGPPRERSTRKPPAAKARAASTKTPRKSP